MPNGQCLPPHLLWPQNAMDLLSLSLQPYGRSKTPRPRPRPKPRSLIFALPVEIRIQIYKYIFDQLYLDTIWHYYTGTKDITQERGSIYISPRERSARRHLVSPSGSLEILLLCRQIYDEAEPILYRSVRFLLRPHDQQRGYVAGFFDSLSDRARENVTHLQCIWDPQPVDKMSKPARKFWSELCFYRDRRLTNAKSLELATGRLPLDLIQAEVFSKMLRFRRMKRLELTVPYELEKNGPTSTTRAVAQLRLRVSTLFDDICAWVLVSNTCGRPRPVSHWWKEESDTQNHRLRFTATTIPTRGMIYRTVNEVKDGGAGASITNSSTASFISKANATGAVVSNI